MTVYMVNKNWDLTEGKGPMLPVQIFSTKQLAISYINNQTGVMGRTTKEKHIDNHDRIIYEKNDHNIEVWYVMGECY